MYLPPRYTYMNYGAPFATGSAAPPVPQPGSFNPYYPYGAPINPKQKVASPKQGFGCNSGYLLSPLGILRLLLIPSLIATVIASALIRNRDWAVYTESSWNTSVWITTLVFACVGLATVLLIFLINVCNIVNLPGIRLVPCTILFALFDLAWFAALTVLGAFCARREAVNHVNFKNWGLNQGAFGVTAAFALLSALFFLLSGLIGLIKRKAPLRSTNVQRLAQPFPGPVPQGPAPLGSVPVGVPFQPTFVPGPYIR